MDRLHIIVKGIVQGVFFRASTRRKADELGLVGWVRNMDDGSVEIVAEGENHKLQELLLWCGKGPGGAAVEEVIPQWMPGKQEFRTFEVLR